MDKTTLKEIFPVETQLINEGKCPVCGELINMADFRDDLSRQEHRITGLCQKDQDKFFDDIATQSSDKDAFTDIITH